MITKKTCPKCGSDNVVMVSKGMTNVWMCRNCGFTGNMTDEQVIGKEGGNKNVRERK